MTIAVLTSGGDAPGMNAAIRGVVRAGTAGGHAVIGVADGYEGLMAGRFVDLAGVDLDDALRQGGTLLGTARSKGFRTVEGREKAVAHLMERGVARLVVIGGDGSLAGAALLAQAWTGRDPSATVVGIAASIDNDLGGSDRTLGCDSALRRVVDALDALESTARSHQRAFVVEVMGRACGWLATASAVGTGADHVLLPENRNQNWRTGLRNAIVDARSRGRRQSIVVLAEGACSDGTPIHAYQVADALRELDLDTRVTVLGHVQRGGVPSALDRLHGTRAGERAVTTASGVLHHAGDRLTLASFQPKERDSSVLPSIQRALAGAVQQGQTGHILVSHVGAPAPGMNAALRATVRMLHLRNLRPSFVTGGFRRVGRVDPVAAGWMDVEGWASRGSTSIGTTRWKAVDGFKFKAALSRHDVTGCVLIGGFGALQAASLLQLPTAVIPATISNNVPGTDASIGMDTALNAICQAVDGLRQSARGTRRRVFFVEVMGAQCGFLARTAGVCVGADRVYTPEAPPDLEQLRSDVAQMRKRVNAVGVGIVLVANGLDSPWDTRTLAALYDEGSRFDTRVCVLGHVQQGGSPSAADRLLAARFAHDAVNFLVPPSNGAVLIGLRDGEVVRTPVASVLQQADQKNRRPSSPRP